jgi:hypothetical protein
MLTSVRQRINYWLAMRRVPPALAAGDVCSIASGDGKFSIAKVLVREPGAVHVRVYSEKFVARPERVDTKTLSLGTIHDEHIGIGHLPLSDARFGDWRPVVIGNEPIDDEELDGYKEWRDSGGDFW